MVIWLWKSHGFQGPVIWLDSMTLEPDRLGRNAIRLSSCPWHHWHHRSGFWNPKRIQFQMGKTIQNTCFFGLIETAMERETCFFVGIYRWREMMKWLLNIYDYCAFRKKRNTHLFFRYPSWNGENYCAFQEKHIISPTSLLLELGIPSSHPEFMWFSSRSFGNLCYCDYLKLDHKV